jgi:glucan 1,3-beta-glucosidase
VSSSQLFGFRKSHYFKDFVYTSDDAQESAEDHTLDIDSNIQSSLQNASEELERNIVIDEWCCALPSESLSQESDAVTAQRNFCQAQVNVYGNVTAGWSFWSE